MTSLPPPTDVVPIWMVCATAALAVTGIISNSMIVLSTILSNGLHSKCNIMIGILAFTDVVVCIHLVHLRILMLQNWYFVPNRMCFVVSLYGLFALNVQSGMGLALGIDRLLAVFTPLKYIRIPAWFYVLMMVCVFIYATAITVFGFIDTDVTIVPVCLPPTAYSDRARKVWIVNSLWIAIFVLIVYAVAHVQCKKLKNSSVTNEHKVERMQRLLNSLTIVVSVYSFTWFLTVVAIFLCQVLPMSESTIDMINQQLGWLVIINASTNFYIYLWRADEYRRAFLKILLCGRYTTDGEDSVFFVRIFHFRNRQQKSTGYPLSSNSFSAVIRS